MASMQSSDGEQLEVDTDSCIHAFQSGNKLMVEQLLPRIKPALVRKTFQSSWYGRPTTILTTNVSLLHLAASCGWIDIAVLLVNKYDCSAKWRDCESSRPLHYAAYYGHLELVKYFITELHCDPLCENYFGTPLHIACSKGHLNITQYLISEAHCNPLCVKSMGDTPLHVACEYGHLNIVQYLISEVNCDPSYTNYYGYAPLNYACTQGHLNIVQYFDFICEANHNFSLFEDDYGTPLDIACENGHLNIVKYLISESHWNPSCVTNGSYTTPLHFACENGHLNIVKYLISEAHWNPSCVTSVGNTPLHLACCNNHAHIVQYLLSTGRVNPLAENIHEDTPLSLATGKYDIIKLLQPYADCSRDYPVHTFTKLILTGDSGAGKTTIAQHIVLASSTPLRGRLARWLLPGDRVTDVERLTAGIVQHHIKSKLGNFVIYDFAGQQEYYSSHAAVLELVMRRSAAMFLCIIDLSKSKEEMCESLQYWLTFIDNASSMAEGTSHVVIIGSHADQILSSKEKKKKISLLQEIAASRVKRQEYAGYVTIDCRYANTAASRQLISILTNSQEAITASQPAISYYCHVLYAILCTKLERAGCTLQHLISVIEKENDLFFSKDPSVLIELLTILSDKGLILFIQHPQSNWVFVKTEVLLNDINGTLFAPCNFKEHRNLASNTGVVPTFNLLKVFSQYDQEMLLSFLMSLDFCRPVDPSVLQYTNLQTASSHSTVDLLFFPGLIQSERPGNLTQHATLQFGWCLGCVDSNQFFGSRFLHLLLLSIAYRFPLAIQHNVSSSLHGLQRRCSVWKNGISWTDSDNITTIVELINKNRWVLVAMSCNKDRPVDHAKLRSALISLVHGLQQKQCPSLKVCEYLISTSLIQQYPLDDLPDTDLFDIQHVADSILHHKPSVLSQNTCIGILPTQTLPLEPYHLISLSSVCQLFNSSMANQPVPVPILQEVQKHICQPSKSLLMCKELRECLDSMSIFAGRNPLKVAGLKEEDLPTFLPPTSAGSSMCSCRNTQQSEEVHKLEKEELLIASPKASTTGDPSSILTQVTTASRPTMSELISMKKRDGSKGKLRIIEWITAHKLTQCVDFAHKLLVDPLPVKQLSTKHEERKEEFVRAVLQKWLDQDDDDENEESLPCTWDALIQCCEDANLDGVFIKLLRGNIPE